MSYVVFLRAIVLNVNKYIDVTALFCMLARASPKGVHWRFTQKQHARKSTVENTHKITPSTFLSLLT